MLTQDISVIGIDVKVKKKIGNRPYKSFTAHFVVKYGAFVVCFTSRMFCIKTLRILHSRNLDNVDIHDVLLLKKM